MRIHNSISSPSMLSNVGQIMNILSLDGAGHYAWLLVVDEILRTNSTPCSFLAIKHPKNSGEVIHIPNFQKTATKSISCYKTAKNAQYNEHNTVHCFPVLSIKHDKRV
ncbi:unnamed protein product [Fraxinus pennsylvanica]|uniref:Uncharacterized protein n=1 Tax=Fraxinus pennsylvanica TaxID=56036 RepID=A0AAD2EH22_9LAMI|nr:unnamed protein product [Fraxinus pennsylvanica]